MNIILCPLQRWTSTHAKIPDAAAHLRSQIDMAAEIGCSAINIPTSEKLEYLVDQSAKAQAIMETTRNLHDYARSRGLGTTQSGPSLLKHWGLAQRMTLPVEYHEVAGFETLNITKSTTEGRIFFPEVGEALGSEPNYRLCRIKIVSNQPGTVYLRHPDETVLNKRTIAAGAQNSLSHMNLPGVKPRDLVFVSSGAKVAQLRIRGYSTHEYPEGALNSNGHWIGTSEDGFLHCRMPDPRDALGIARTFNMAQRYLEDVPQICCCDELNSPFGHSLDQELYPGGWPQWLGEYLAGYAALCEAQTYQEPLFFLTDPRTRVSDLIHNRYCAPVPEGYTPDYLWWLAKRTTRPTICIWGEDAPFAFWQNNFQRVSGFGFDPAIGIYAGRQSVSAVAEGIGIQTLRNLPILVFYWEPTRADVLHTIRELKRILA
ncbi:hypothetical protein KJZ99_00160 [bacterium]|nr:hypothetical protein [bacterium]